MTAWVSVRIRCLRAAWRCSRLALLVLLGACAARTAPPLPPLPTPSAVPPPVVETPPPPRPAPRGPARTAVEPEPPVETVALTRLVTPATPPERAAALGLVEEARLALNRGELTPAVELAERSLAVDPSLPYGYYFLGRAALRADRPEDTLGFAHRAAALLHGEPHWLGAVYALEGAAYEALGRPADARSAYLRCLTIAPGNMSARAGAARLRRR